MRLESFSAVFLINLFYFWGFQSNTNTSSLFKILRRLSTLCYTVSRRIVLKVGNARVERRAQLENWRTAQHVRTW
jgi:hypothetical protein